MQPIVVTTSCGNFEEAEKVAQQLLSARLAACVQISTAQSMYWWKDNIESDKEYILKIKSRRALFDKVVLKITENHSYDVPEIIATDIVAVEQSYRNWLHSELTNQ